MYKNISTKIKWEQIPTTKEIGESEQKFVWKSESLKSTKFNPYFVFAQLFNWENECRQSSGRYEYFTPPRFKRITKLRALF